MIEPLKLKQTLKAAELQDGDIICFQKQTDRKGERSTLEKRLGLGEKEKDVTAKLSPTKIEDAREFYDFLAHRVTVKFQAHPTKCDATKYPAFVMQLHPHKMGYDQMAEHVAQHFDLQQTHLRFWTVNPSGNPRASVKRNAANPPMVATILNIPTPQVQQMPTVSRDEYTLYFEILDINLSELELSKNIKLTWLSEGITKETLVDMFVPKHGTIDTLVETMMRKLELADEQEAGPIRVFEATQNRFFRELSRDWPVVNINEYSTMYAERVPSDEVGMEPNQFIQCFNYSTEPSRSHGVPFRLMLKEVCGIRKSLTKSRSDTKMLTLTLRTNRFPRPRSGLKRGLA